MIELNMNSIHSRDKRLSLEDILPPCITEPF